MPTDSWGWIAVGIVTLINLVFLLGHIFVEWKRGIRDEQHFARYLNNQAQIARARGAYQPDLGNGEERDSVTEIVDALEADRGSRARTDGQHSQSRPFIMDGDEYAGDA